MYDKLGNGITEIMRVLTFIRKQEYNRESQAANAKDTAKWSIYCQFSQQFLQPNCMPELSSKTVYNMFSIGFFKWKNKWLYIRSCLTS